VERWITGLWYGGRSWALPLLPLAALYALWISLRRAAYASGLRRSGLAGKPVVVVGNLTVGGTGKTPLTLWLARELTALDIAVGIVSRGYGGSNGRRPRMVGGGAPWDEVGDEPLILARRSGCPTVVATDRLAAARTLGASVDVILADDGLQHLRLARDCEVVVIDGTRGFGNRWLLPAGPLREPLRRLAHADVLVVNGEARHPSLKSLPQPVFTMNIVPHAVQRLDARVPPRSLEDFRGQKVHAVAGTGNPARFFAELREHGLQTIEHPFPDHHPLAVSDLAFDDGLPVLMTEKDAVKCATRADPRLWFVQVVAEFSDADARALLERVLGRISKTSGGGE
jgi:tetraacyldisaccharide 4'-kinase